MSGDRHRDSLYNPYAKTERKTGTKLTVTLSPQTRRATIADDPEQDSKDKTDVGPNKRKFVSNPYKKKTPLAMEEFDTIDEMALITALESSERKCQKVTSYNAPDCDLVQCLDNASGLDDTALINALETAIQNHRKAKCCDVTTVPETSKPLIRQAIVTPIKTVPIHTALTTPSYSLQRNLVTPSATMLDPEVGELEGDTKLANKKSQAWRHGGAGSRVLECVTFQPTNLFGHVPAVTDDDPIESSQDSLSQDEPESLERRQLRLRSASIAKGLEKVVKRKFPTITRPEENLMECIDRLRTHDLLPHELLDAMSDIRWLGYIARHQCTFKLAGAK